MIAQIYTGCKCSGGETWRINLYEEIDMEKDEVNAIIYCTTCMATMLTPKVKEGVLVMHALTNDEIEEVSHWDESDELNGR
jgi:hypothetical protein